MNEALTQALESFACSSWFHPVCLAAILVPTLAAALTTVFAEIAHARGIGGGR